MIDRYKDAGPYKPYLIFALTDETYSLLCDGNVPGASNAPLYRFLVSLFNQCECLVVQREDKLVGLVYPDQEQVKKLRLSKTDIETIMEQNRKEINPNLPQYAQLFSIKVMENEFEKTPKKSIKRFLYT